MSELINEYIFYERDCFYDKKLEQINLLQKQNFLLEKFLALSKIYQKLLKSWSLSNSGVSLESKLTFTELKSIHSFI